MNHDIVSGFDTFCSILIDVNHTQINLLACTPFSNGDLHFVSKSERKLHETGQLKNIERGKQIDEFDKNGFSIDQSVIISNQINKIDTFLKSENPNLCIVDIIDRGFDDQKFFKELKNLKHEFICRAKGNRKSNEVILDEDGNEKPIRLLKEQFMQGDEVAYSSIKFKQKTYQNCKGVFEWNKIELDKNVYSVLRVSLYQQNGSRVFKEDMLIITSFEIEDIKMAQLIWELYMKRSKIESVFKFCKEELKWESPRIDDWETMQNLLSAVYFIAGYFY